MASLPLCLGSSEAHCMMSTTSSRGTPAAAARSHTGRSGAPSRPSPRAPPPWIQYLRVKSSSKFISTPLPVLVRPVLHCSQWISQDPVKRGLCCSAPPTVRPADGQLLEEDVEDDRAAIGLGTTHHCGARTCGLVDGSSVVDADRYDPGRARWVDRGSGRWGRRASDLASLDSDRWVARGGAREG